MPVLCVRGNGTVSTHILTVLSVEGVRRLLSASRSPLAPQVLQWLSKQVEELCGSNPPDPPPSSSSSAIGGAKTRSTIALESSTDWRSSGSGGGGGGVPPLLLQSSPSSSSSSSTSSMRSSSSGAAPVSALEVDDSLQRRQRSLKTESAAEAEAPTAPSAGE